MLRLILGFRTDKFGHEDPQVLYCGHDGVKSQSTVDQAQGFAHLKLAYVTELQLARKRPGAGVLAQLSEEDSELLGKLTGPPSIEEGVAMLKRIGELEKLLADQARDYAEERKGVQEEFARQIQVAADEIRALKDRLATYTPHEAGTESSQEGSGPADGESAGGPSTIHQSPITQPAEEPPLSFAEAVQQLKDAFTVPQLRKLAEDEAVDLTGLRLEQEIAEAIVTARRAEAGPSLS